MLSLSEKAGKMRKGFALFPLLFFLCGCLLFAVVLYPTARPMLSVLSLLIQKEPPSFGDDPIELPTSSSDSSVPTGDTVPLSTLEYPKSGECYGQIRIPSAEIDCPLYYGDDKKSLKKGAGTYTGTFIPGYDRTTLIAGHNHTFFSTLGSVAVGDSVFIDTKYGNYEYRVTGTRIADYDDETAYDLSKRQENIILYTCYPFKILGFYQQRLFIYGEYISGPMIDKDR